jgi:hypothetical protein
MVVKVFLALVGLLGLFGTVAGIILATGGSVGPFTGSVPLGITVAGFSAGLIFILIASFTEKRLWMILAAACMIGAALAGSMGVFSPWLSAAAILGCVAILIAVTTKASDIAGTKKGP